MEAMADSHPHLGFVPGSKYGKGLGRDRVPPFRGAEDLLDHGFGQEEYLFNAHEELVKVPSARECMDDALGLRNNDTGYRDLVSDMNWAVEDRVRLKIPSDPQVVPAGSGNLHFRPHLTAAEYLRRMEAHRKERERSLIAEDFTPLDIKTPSEPSQPDGTVQGEQNGTVAERAKGVMRQNEQDAEEEEESCGASSSSGNEEDGADAE